MSVTRSRGGIDCPASPPVIKRSPRYPRQPVWSPGRQSRRLTPGECLEQRQRQTTLNTTTAWTRRNQPYNRLRLECRQQPTPHNLTPSPASRVLPHSPLASARPGRSRGPQPRRRHHHRNGGGLHQHPHPRLHHYRRRHRHVRGHDNLTIVDPLAMAINQSFIVNAGQWLPSPAR